MKNTLILLFCLFLWSCSSKIKLGRYKNKCYSTDAPVNILFVEKNNRFVLIYPSSVEKLSGTWSAKNDTLVLNAQYQSFLENEKDRTIFNGKYIYGIKNGKLLNPNNKKCYLKFQK
ncbi:hypothetical protein [Chryseobacterium sp. OSA05B]|uniref:hypothetical protein n=1 Tax=Chryseobacterium sp. OSA05B TaxID=2862650 RepID=UPI001CC1B963|nr:hypothetical protein [Chryseobacterium sp. OSA05B]